jgi:hypothetical protein
MVNNLVLPFVAVVTFLVVYHLLVHSLRYRIVPLNDLVETVLEITKFRIPTRLYSITRALFNPSISMGGRGNFMAIVRFTPGHQITAGAAYFFPGREDDIDMDYGFFADCPHRVRFLPRAILYQNSSKEGEPVYVPVNMYPWQTETRIWKQGEDIRLINGPEGEILGMGVLLEARTGGTGVCSRLALGGFKRLSDNLCWIPRMLLNARGESDKNWTLLKRNNRDLYFLTTAFPCWRIVVVNFDERTVRPAFHADTSKIARAMDVRISNHGKHYERDVLGALHLGGGEAAEFLEGKKLLAFHTHRPYRTVFCEIDPGTLLPTRLSFPVSVGKEGRGIELVTSVSELDETRLLLGVGVEDSSAEIIVHRKRTIDKILKINVASSLSPQSDMGLLTGDLDNSGILHPRRNGT